MSQKISYYVFKVFHDDTDFLGIMYHGNHLKYFERGRTNFLFESGFTHTSFKEKFNLIFVVYDIALTYLKPIYLEDECVVETKLMNIKNPKLIFSQMIKKNGIVMSKAIVTVVVLNASLKLAQLPKDLLSKF